MLNTQLWCCESVRKTKTDEFSEAFYARRANICIGIRRIVDARIILEPEITRRNEFSLMILSNDHLDSMSSRSRAFGFFKRFKREQITLNFITLKLDQYFLLISKSAEERDSPCRIRLLSDRRVVSVPSLFLLMAFSENTKSHKIKHQHKNEQNSGVENFLNLNSSTRSTFNSINRESRGFSRTFKLSFEFFAYSINFVW